MALAGLLLLLLASAAAAMEGNVPRRVRQGSRRAPGGPPRGAPVAPHRAAPRTRLASRAAREAVRGPRALGSGRAGREGSQQPGVRAPRAPRSRTLSCPPPARLPRDAPRQPAAGWESLLRGGELSPNSQVAAQEGGRAREQPSPPARARGQQVSGARTTRGARGAWGDETQGGPGWGRWRVRPSDPVGTHLSPTSPRDSGAPGATAVTVSRHFGGTGSG